MWSQSTPSRHRQDFFAACFAGVFIQQVLRLLSFFGLTSALGRCSCAAALSTFVRSSSTMECFLLVPLPFSHSFLTTRSRPRGAGTGLTCSVDSMYSFSSTLLKKLGRLQLISLSKLYSQYTEGDAPFTEVNFMS